MVKKQIPKEPNQNSSATLEFEFEFESLTDFRKKKKKRRKYLEENVFFLKTGFILYYFGMDCIYFQNGLFLFFVFLGKFYCEFSNYEAKFLFHHALCDSI